MQKEVGIPRKERAMISQSIFGQSGMVNADTSFEFDDKSGDVLSTVSKVRRVLHKNIETHFRTLSEHALSRCSFLAVMDEQ